MNLSVPTESLEEIDRARLSIFTEAARSAYCVDGLPIRRLVTSPSFVIERITTTDKGGGGGVEVSFRCNEPDIWVASGRLIFRPEQSWVLSEYDLKKKATISTHFPRYDWIAGKVTCREWSPGLILPAGSASWTSHDRVAKDGIHVTVLNATYKDVPESQFKTSKLWPAGLAR